MIADQIGEPLAVMLLLVHADATGRSPDCIAADVVAHLKRFGPGHQGDRVRSSRTSAYDWTALWANQSSE